MNLEEFEKLISQDEHKDDIMFLVNEGINCGGLKGKAVEKWYDDCAQLYNKSLAQYAHTKVNYSKILDTLRYQSYILRRDVYLQKRIAENYANIITEMDNFAQTHYLEYNDHQILSEIEKLLDVYSRNALFIDGKLEELQDSVQILDLHSVLHSEGGNLHQIKFEVSKVNQTKTYDADGKKEKLHTWEINESYVLKSNKGKQLFTDCFLDYFMNRYIEHEYDQDKLKKTIDYYKGARKKLLKKLIRDIYIVFIRHDKVDFNNDKDTYHFSEKRDGCYLSLKTTISEWIFDLLVYFSYVNKIEDEEFEEYSTIKKKKKDYIRYCMEDETVLTWEMSLPSNDWPYL